MAKRKEKPKEEKIKSEKNRLKRIFKNLDENKKSLVTPLIEKAAFMSVELDELQAVIENEGWTSEYNNEIKTNEDYINDGLVSGTLQLAKVDDEGNYEPDTSLTFFITQGAVESRVDSDIREEITAWYEEQKAAISEKENWLDIEIDDLSTELESINTEIQSVKSFIDDAISSVFDWGSR